MEVYRFISDMVLGLEPSSFWMVILTTITILLVGTSGRFINGVWRTQFAVVQNVTGTVFTFISTLFFWVFMLAFLVVPLTPIWIPVIVIRKLEEWIYSRWYGCERMNSDALTWMFDTPENTSVIHGAMIMESEFQIESLREVTRKKWYEPTDEQGRIKYPYIRRYIHSGFFYYYWRPEENFDIKRHVYEWSTKIYSKKELPGVIKEIMKSPFHRGQKISPWEQILIHFLSDGVNKTCLLVRASHTIADGTAIINFFINHVADEPSVVLPVPKLSTSLKMFIKIKGLYYLPLTVLGMLITPVPSHDLHNIDPSGTKNIMWSEPISLNLIKAIKNKLHVTVNDVLLGCLATKLHQYFKDSGKTPPEEFNAGVPFDTRLSIEEAEEFVNKFAVINVKLPTRDGDAVRNIQEIRAQMNALKVSASHHGLRAAMRVMNYSLPTWVVKPIHKLFVSRLSMVLSNVPGPQLPFKFAGTTVQSMHFVPPGRDHIGMSVSLLSYSNNVFITFCCDDALGATSSQLLDGFPQLFSTVAENLGITDVTTFE